SHYQCCRRDCSSPSSKCPSIRVRTFLPFGVRELASEEDSLVDKPSPSWQKFCLGDRANQIESIAASMPEQPSTQTSQTVGQCSCEGRLRKAQMRKDGGQRNFPVRNGLGRRLPA